LLDSISFPSEFIWNNVVYEQSAEAGWVHWDFLVDIDDKLIGFGVYELDVDFVVGWTKDMGKMQNGRIELYLNGFNGGEYLIKNEQAFGSKAYVSSGGASMLALMEWENEFDCVEAKGDRRERGGDKPA